MPQGRDRREEERAQATYLSPSVTVVRAENPDTSAIAFLTVGDDVPERLFDRVDAEQRAIVAEHLELVVVVARNHGNVSCLGRVRGGSVPVVW